MKYKNALRIPAYVWLITITTGTHLGQEKNQEGIEATKHNEKQTTLEKKVARFDDDELTYTEIENSSSLELPKGQYNSIEGDSTDFETDRKKLMQKDSSCWLSLDANTLFKTMDGIDNRYADVRKSVQNEIVTNKFDEKMLQAMLFADGAAIRDLYQAQERRHLIPAGLNLGGYCMMRMPDSVLFFYRMKLRNNTRFRVNYLNNDLANMVLTARLSLNDLHLRGAYERSVTDRDPSVLFYAPSFGEVDLLLKNVEYKMEGRYRLIKERLVIEVLISEVLVKDILMTYINGGIENPCIKVDKGNIEEFIDRMKTDLDKWLKDYFNDFLMYTDLHGIEQLNQLEKYDKDKAIALNEYMDIALDQIRRRIHKLKATAIKMPNFIIMGINGFQISMHNGVFRGLDSIYRRSVATSKRDKDIRKVDAIVGFSNLKVKYQYEALIPTGEPPVSGVLTLSMNELTAHLSLAMVKEPETVDIDIDFLDQTKPESLTVEGSANTMISNFVHLLEHQIIAIMSNALVHGIKTLRSLPKCEPFLPGQIYSEKKNSVNKQHVMGDLAEKDGDNNEVSETNEYGHYPSIRSKRNTSDFRKRNQGSKTEKKDFRRKHKHSKKKHRGSKKKSRSSKKKHRHGH